MPIGGTTGLDWTSQVIATRVALQYFADWNPARNGLRIRVYGAGRGLGRDLFVQGRSVTDLALQDGKLSMQTKDEMNSEIGGRPATDKYWEDCLYDKVN